MLVSIKDFSFAYKAQDEDVHYNLDLREYKQPTLKVISQNKQTSTSTNARASTGFAVGDTVKVNGNYWYSSYGSEPHGTFKNYTGKISYVVADKSRPYRFLIEGRGWVSDSQLG